VSVFLILSLSSILAQLNRTGGGQSGGRPTSRTVRVSIESAVEKSQYSARAPYAEFDSSGNSISASCRKPQVICARPASSRPADATRLRFPLRLCSANVKAIRCVAHLPPRVKALATALSRLGNRGNHCSTCLPETYRGYSLGTGETEGGYRRMNRRCHQSSP